MRAVARSLALRLNGDPSVVDAARIHYGSRNAETWLFDRGIDEKFLDELIAQSFDPPQTDTAGGVAIATARSTLSILPTQPVRLANGPTRPFSKIDEGTAVHCPFHDDRHPSAFVLANRRGIKGIHCSTCGTSFWPANSGPNDFEFFEFDRAVRESRAYFDEKQDYGSLGPLLNSPLTHVGLTDVAIDISTDSPVPPELPEGLLFIKSPKGSGKTEGVKALLSKASSRLLIGHRPSLIRQTCDRLGLHCYLDDEHPWPNPLVPYGICLDSLTKIPWDLRYEVLILDEAEQLLAHFLSPTIEHRLGGGRSRLFNIFTRLVRQAKHVIALDADLSWPTFSTISRMVSVTIKGPNGETVIKPEKPLRVRLNSSTSAREKVIQVFRLESQLIAEVQQAIADGKRCFITSNAKTKIERISQIIAHECGEPLKRLAFEDIKDRLEDGDSVSESEWWSYERTRLELFYRQKITPGLIKLDNHGKYRAQVRQFERLVTSNGSEALISDVDLISHPHAQFVSQSEWVLAAIKLSLSHTPVMRDGTTGPHTDNVFDRSDLADFIQFVRAHKAVIENLLGFEVRTDFESNPVQQLNQVLKLLGLRVVKAKPVKKAKRKVYRYHLDLAALRRLRLKLYTRLGYGGWSRLHELHGWSAQAEGGNDEGEGDAD
jgi:hypothetical protein